MTKHKKEHGRKIKEFVVSHILIPLFIGILIGLCYRLLNSREVHNEYGDSTQCDVIECICDCKYARDTE